MLVKILKSKLHRARVTDAKLHYPGSIEIDSALMEAASLLPYESVLVADVTNGSRLETYVVPAEAGSGEIVILGAAAQLIQPKDIVIILGFGYMTPDEAKSFKPNVVVLDEKNQRVRSRAKRR
jgi:aspartate 1-decarboxylase